ncbi:MAG: hypothetical protein DRP09_20905, partial [Candidatus Thorarchaeota archaeon]
RLVFNAYHAGNAPWLNITYTVDTTPPEITINFAGNLSDYGGPWYRPPGEDGVSGSTQLTGDFANGYYTNDSRQQEDWMYINLTVTDVSGVDEVWLHWYNQSDTSGNGWTNNSYQFTHTGGNYWEYNTSGNIPVAPGCNYSFDIWAKDTKNNVNVTWWNKTGQGSGYTRRYVQLNHSPTDITYANNYAFYFYQDTDKASYGSGDVGAKDILHHDQGGAAGGTDNVGFLTSTIVTDQIEKRWGSTSFCYWFDDDVCTKNFTLDNIYYHFWWNLTVGTPNIKFGCDDRRDEFPSSGWNWLGSTYETVGTAVTNVTYDSKKYRLATAEIDITDTDFGDNNMYEFLLQGFQSSYSPSIICNRSILSFVLFNVPNNDTLNTTYGDSDSDGLTDWQELYQTYTHPFLSDTDNDGSSDNAEYLAGTDPNNYTDVPSANNDPVLSNPNPSNGSIDQNLVPTLSVQVNDVDADCLDLTWYSNSSGTLKQFGQILSSSSTNRFGYDTVGSSSSDINDTIRGSYFTCPANGTAQGIYAYAHLTGDLTDPTKTKCAIYYKSNNTLLAETQEKSTTVVDTPKWLYYTFTVPPALKAGEEYYIVMWADVGAYGATLYYDAAPNSISRGGFQSQSYGTFPDPWSPTAENRFYSLYCIYSTSCLPNGTYYMDNLNFSSYGTTYWWTVNASDGKGGSDNETYHFTTRAQNVPDPPSSFTATTIDHQQIDLSWTKGNKADYTYI